MCFPKINISKYRSYQLKNIDKNSSIIQLIENNKKLHFNFRDNKQIDVPKIIHDGVKCNEDTIRTNITTMILNYKHENELKLIRKLQHITCNDLTDIIVSYL